MTRLQKAQTSKMKSLNADNGPNLISRVVLQVLYVVVCRALEPTGGRQSDDGPNFHRADVFRQTLLAPVA